MYDQTNIKFIYSSYSIQFCCNWLRAVTSYLHFNYLSPPAQRQSVTFLKVGIFNIMQYKNFKTEIQNERQSAHHLTLHHREECDSE